MITSSSITRSTWPWDTFPYCGGTTTCDAIMDGEFRWSALRGTLPSAVVGLSILTNVGLPELVAESQQRYVEIATELAGNLPRLSQLRSTLRQRMQQSPLMDAPRFARGIESAYRRMWLDWCTMPPGQSLE